MHRERTKKTLQHNDAISCFPPGVGVQAVNYPARAERIQLIERFNRILRQTLTWTI